MFCINCGKQVNDTDPFCPYCGAKLDNANNVQPQVAPVDPMMGAQQVAPTDSMMGAQQVAPANPMMGAQQVAPADPMMAAPQATPTDQVIVAQQATPVNPMMATPVQQAPAQPAQQENKGKSKTPLLIAILAVVIAAGAFIVWKNFMSPSDTGTGTNTPAVTNQQAEEVAEAAGKKATYLGYTFTIPEGFESKNDAKYGLVVYSDQVIYSILIDFSNDYEKYRTALQTKYPTQINDIEKTVGTRKYLIGKVESSGNIGSEFISTANGTASFVGIVINKNNTVEYEDYKLLTEMLDSSTVAGSTFAAGDENDPGKNGPIMFDIDRSALGFTE